MRERLVGRHVAVDVAVDDDEGADGAGAHAADLLDVQRQVRRRAARRDPGVPLELLQEPRRAAHVTGGAHADGAGVLAARLGVEAVVEGGHPVHLRARQPQVGSPSPRNASSVR